MQLKEKSHHDAMDYIYRQASRRIGSTTTAIITIPHHMTDLFKTNNFVTVMLPDSANAFATIRHKHFLQDRGHITRNRGMMSTFAPIMPKDPASASSI